jgi:hypothetical protein
MGRALSMALANIWPNIRRFKRRQSATPMCVHEFVTMAGGNLREETAYWLEEPTRLLKRQGCRRALL